MTLNPSFERKLPFHAKGIDNLNEYFDDNEMKPKIKLCTIRTRRKLQITSFRQEIKLTFVFTVLRRELHFSTFFNSSAFSLHL